MSDEEARRSDPLAPLLIGTSCLKLARSLSPKFYLCYLDHGSISSEVIGLLRDLHGDGEAFRAVHWPAAE